MCVGVYVKWCLCIAHYMQSMGCVYKSVYVWTQAHHTMICNLTVNEDAHIKCE